MTTQEIDRDHWTAFFDAFSRRHEGWLATIEIFGLEFGDQIEARDQALRGITADVAGMDVPSISVMLGNSDDDRFTHVVPGPVSVRVQEDGVRKCVEIQESGGSTTVLQFHDAPMLENAGF
ncbi:MAG: DUF5335 family protein [Planctomycetes bacterium]|nr:DUF5335 family protein [Planctomycetota bacterium]MBI3844824.1 DUF5335 family protein [Planctomycetota bacterium]